LSVLPTRPTLLQHLNQAKVPVALVTGSSRDRLLQTAGEEREFVMYGIASPKHVRDIIVEAQDLVLETSKLEV